MLGEARFAQRFGVKLAGVHTSDSGVPGEYGAAGIGLLTYYLPTTLARVEPVVGLGGIYSGYHWNQYGQSGTIRDLNVGGSFGANLRFHRSFRTGVHLFVANGFQATYTDGMMRKTGRRLLALPALTLEVLL